ncbi:amidophosphoribosyltransferase [Sandaracinus amylolyticus]|uniref:Amidophosphoribosyltransferase n=1 Tax=Sandaracinus amylolyticus TaxID=927083 RepID=A0A0F6YKG7_9BACT|nr:amidophosphoribosyltransferase [Sandaracinus amylolyticus]AKF07253.1 Amidophosphoribosyltransferase [Sandaracinus amylolyticus]
MCGVVGIWGAPQASNLTYLGLHALQHRGQESAGIVSSDGGRLFAHKSLGLVQDAFSQPVLEALPGDRAIGHVRYSTAGGGGLKNAQPIAVDYAMGSLAVGHNGNFTNFEEVRTRLEAAGSIFNSSSDTEVLVHLIARSREATTVGRVSDALKQMQGAYSIVFLTTDELIAVRDPHGFRPLCLGTLSSYPGLPGATVVASEPSAFELIGAEYVRDLEPGEMIVADREGVRSLRPFETRAQRMCIFEYVYFARPDSKLNGISVYDTRKRLGAILAEECPADVDVVIPVPDSGVASALGYAGRLGIPFELGLIRSHYVGRTFIEPSQSIRHFGVKLKLSPVRAVLEGKRVAVIDDSIVRGTTSRKIVKMLRDAGAKEVHLRISSPPTRWPCYYGIDTPSRNELIAASHSPAEVAKYVTSDTVGYLSIDGLHRAVRGEGPGRQGFCDACFSGDYPVPFATENGTGKRSLPLASV